MYNHSLMISTTKKHANGKRAHTSATEFLDFSSIVTHKSKEELKADPDSDKCYNLTLGPSFKDESSNKYCTLRYTTLDDIYGQLRKK
ncbi:hypothetical protein MTR_7g114200 [Medicago truncatula]|uniref:Uncharacterized protein n=1 Tax=Medicago truncatula TaxID=3880 RepID=G7KZT2_MEDTR|nr:hypothetical protein MTR_7g114200 [Medicago truncatula]